MVVTLWRRTFLPAALAGSQLSVQNNPATCSVAWEGKSLAYAFYGNNTVGIHLHHQTNVTQIWFNLICFTSSKLQVDELYQECLCNMLLINPKTRVVVLNPSPNVYRFPLPCHNNTPEINTIVQNVSPHRWSKTAAVIHYQKECWQSLIYRLDHLPIGATMKSKLFQMSVFSSHQVLISRIMALRSKPFVFVSYDIQAAACCTSTYRRLIIWKKPLPCILGSVWSLHCTEEDSQTKSATEPWNKERQIISNK